jgi:tetratricopeptide (TPR) repeat protein
MVLIRGIAMIRKKPSVGKALIVIILAGVVPISYFYSHRVYSFYMRTYYEKIRGQSLQGMVRKGWALYDRKKYAELRDYLEPLVIVYPSSRDLKILEGLVDIKQGRGDLGTDIILSVTHGQQLSGTVLEETIRTLYSLKQYKDVIMTMKKNDAAGNPALIYYYGASLVNTGNYNAAVPLLKEAIARGDSGYDVYLETGIAYSKMNQTRAALPYLERAYRLNPNRDTAGALADAYWKSGRYKDAEKILLKPTR